MAARLAFVDDPGRLTEVPAGFTAVPVDAFSAIELEAGGVDATALDAFLDDLELEEIGERTHALALRAVEALDALLGGDFARRRFLTMKTLYDGLLWQALGAQRLVEATGAEQALLLVRARSFSAAILPVVCERNGVTVSARYSEPALAVESAVQVSLRERLTSALVGVRRVRRRGHPRVLCLDEQYSLPPIAAVLRGRGAEVMLWLPPPRRSRPATVPDLSGLAPLFTVEDVDLWPAAEPLLRELVDQELPGDNVTLAAARAAVRRDRPDVLLASTYAAPEAKAAAVAAREAGVPTVVARHGELAIRQLPVMVFNDLDVVDHALCWGTWEARFCERYAPRPVRTTVVGAPMIEEAVARAPGRAAIRRRLGLPVGERIVLVAPTALSRDEWFLGRRAPTDLAYARHQVALVEALLAVEGVRVVVEEHAVGAGPLETWARGRSLPLTFLHDCAFVELIHAADAVVLDFPSTTLVQALHGSARLYVVRHPVTAWEPGVLEHLVRHGVRVAPAGELAALLRADVAEGLLDAPAAYPQQVREPLLASGAGTAASRAADAVMAIGTGDPVTTIVPG